MRIAFSCEKGGVGKTALAVCLARSFSEHGHKVLFVDLDVQKKRNRRSFRLSDDLYV